MKTAVRIIATVSLAIGGLTACGATGGGSLPLCVDDALIVPAGQSPKPGRSKPRYHKPTKPKAKPTKAHSHHDTDWDCD